MKVLSDLDPISDINQAFRALIRDRGLDWPMMSVRDKKDIAEWLSVIAEQISGRNPKWGWRYIQGVYQGMAPGKLFTQAIMAAGAMIDGVPLELATRPRVMVVAVGDVRHGSLVLGNSHICPCGLSFVGRTWNQKYHSKECRKIHRRHTNNAHSI